VQYGVLATMTIDIELWKFLILQGGLALTTAAAVMWGRGEQRERRATQAQLNAIGARSVEADFTVAKALDKLVEELRARRN
jgi:hypothetical protein